MDTIAALKEEECNFETVRAFTIMLLAPALT